MNGYYYSHFRKRYVRLEPKTPLTPKEQKARNKAKRAKQARKINYKHQQLSAFQLKRKLKAKLSTKNQKQ